METHVMMRIAWLFALTLAVGPALAQAPSPTSPANPTVPVAPPSAPPVPPERIAPADGTGTLSDDLSQRKGVITPPKVDPRMTVEPPQKGAATPVIPPPGSPGGDPSVIPK
jgi:hypothetical protein